MESYADHPRVSLPRTAPALLIGVVCLVAATTLLLSPGCSKSVPSQETLRRYVNTAFGFSIFYDASHYSLQDITDKSGASFPTVAAIEIRDRTRDGTGVHGAYLLIQVNDHEDVHMPQSATLVQWRTYYDRLLPALKTGIAQSGMKIDRLAKGFSVVTLGRNRMLMYEYVATASGEQMHIRLYIWVGNGRTQIGLQLKSKETDWPVIGKQLESMASTFSASK